MSQSLECPRCHHRGVDELRAGWHGRRCSRCGSPMVLASAPAELLVRKYLHGSRLEKRAGRY